VARAVEPLAYDFASALDGLVGSGEYVDFQADYLRLFEVGLGIPPCPLYAGIYRGGRKSVMEELTRFYNYFGLSVEQGKGELPDHISTELEFMHFLAYKELAALARREDAAPYRRAQADFLERQLVSWLPALEARLAGLNPPPFYVALAWLASGLSRTELAVLRRSPDGDPASGLEDRQ
jgi:DMSO reductase family type II enzyme chaperone